MRTRIATLRQRAVQRLSALQQPPAGQAAEIAPSLLANAPQIFKLAYIAVGDADSAALLTAETLAQAPANEGAALHLLVERLPQGWLSWPGASGPSEWLRLGLRREQADRLLSVLGEWSAQERIGLALYLLWDVRRDELDAWLGTHGMAEQVTLFIGYIGEGLGLIEQGGNLAECKEIAVDLLEASDPQIGRAIRLHTIGCEACRRRVSGLRQTAAILRMALHVFFRAPLPKNFEQLLHASQSQRQSVALAYWKPALAAIVVLALWIGMLHRSDPAATGTTLVTAPPRAAELLDRALNRFTQQPAQTGVLHERVRVGTGDTALLLERWYDYRSPQRLRVTVSQPKQTDPVFDLATNGSTWIAYEINNDFRPPLSALVRNPEVGKLMPLLRQLPFVGSFSETPVNQQYMDLTLLAQARRGKPVLLGTTNWRDRPAYVLSSVTEGAGRAILTLDRETLSLLEARIAPYNAGASQIERVWEAETVELLPRTGVPASTFEMTTRATVVSQVDPRRFERYPEVDLDLNTAIRYSSLPVPEFVPGETLISHLWNISDFEGALLQLYESEWSTLAVVAPRFSGRQTPWDHLDREFAHGRYTIHTFGLPQASVASFVMDDVPSRTMQLYLWHALADEDQRQQMIAQILDSLVLVDESNADAYQQRFPVQSKEGKAGSLSLTQRTARINIDALSPAQAARRRYVRSKLEQSYENQTSRSVLGLPVR